MKKNTLILSGFLVCCVAFGYTPIENNANTATEIITSERDYAVVGVTRHSIGENYSIGITVRIDDAYGQMTVLVNGKTVAYSIEGYDEYSIRYGALGKDYYYYFSFKN